MTKPSYRITILGRQTIHSEPEEYPAWPSITRANDGTLLCVFSGGREGHTDPYGKVKLIKSYDGGETWRDLETVASTVLDDRDPGVLVLPSDEIFVTWFTADTGEKLKLYDNYYPQSTPSWRRHLEKIPLKDREAAIGNWATIWDAKRHVWNAPVSTIARTPHGPILLKDGRLLFVGNCGRKYLAVESADQGRTWQVIGEVPWYYRDETTLDEATTIELPGGELRTLWRSENIKGKKRYDRPVLFQSESQDGGKTWSIPLATEIEGFPAHLLYLPARDIMLAVYGWRYDPYGISLCVSRDHGDTWNIGDDELILSDDGMTDDMGYPCTVAMGDDEFLTVFYEGTGWHSKIKSVRWRLT